MSDHDALVTVPLEPTSATPLAWNPVIDGLLASWCDNAKCFEWMHTEAFSLFDRRARNFMITINSLTALSGISNMIAGGFSVGAFQVAWIFGGISIVASTLNILQDKLGYQTSGQLHKKLSSEWAIIRSKIEEVITLPYSGRRDCKTFLRYIKADMNQATIEGNALIPRDIRLACYEKFKAVVGFDIPDICGKVEHTRVFVAEGTTAETLLSEPSR